MISSRFYLDDTGWHVEVGSGRCRKGLIRAMRGGMCGVVAHIAKAGAAREGEEVEAQAACTLRRMSCSVHRENARSVLRRLPAPPLGFSGGGPGALAEEPVLQ